jgi:phosphomannomutase
VSIYQSCDILGRDNSELSPELYRRWGYALGMQIPENAKFVVGGDLRTTTLEYQAALIEGLCHAGLDVVDLGILPTPIIYHAKRRLRADGCAIVTASHHPAGTNGLQWMLRDHPPTPSEVEILRIAAEKSPSLSDRSETVPRTLDISFDYVANLQETFVEAMESNLHVVLDPMYGSWSGKVRRYLHAIFPQCLFTTLRDEPEDRFAEETPDCSMPQLLVDLSEMVYRERADLGIAFDGDGDRVTLVDNHGVVLTPEESACVLLETFPATQWHNQSFVHDEKFSDKLPDRAKELGVAPLVERCEPAFLRARMLESGALFGAEINGHYFYQALEGGDDGLYTACRLIAFLAQDGRTLSDLLRKCPTVFITPDLRLTVPAESQPAILERLRSDWASFPQRMLDGLRIDTPAGWMIVCPSAAEATLSFRFESFDWPALDHLVARFCKTLPDLGNKLRQAYSTAMGASEVQIANN